MTTPCVTGQRLSTLSSQLIPGWGGRDYNLQFTDDGSEALLGGTEKVTQLEGSRARCESEIDSGTFSHFSGATAPKKLSLGAEYIPVAVINEGWRVAST